ncbi:MAG: phosphoribosylformylglycinamidine synthase subunit PurL [Thermoplasmata archaeon]|nr:phosphoribosylformylglycinamidine synthase subunit PurL [Thermoplasmata archaeon]
MPARKPPETAWSSAADRVRLSKLSGAAVARLSAERRWGFSALELRRIQQYFRQARREPTDVEVAGLAQSWSEHCSYKSSRPILRAAFRPLQQDRRVLGVGDAGVMRLGRTLAYALRIESHNHPSAIEPYGGAATGIGGILRDVLAVGAEPVALADPLFFGPLHGGAEPPEGVKHPGYLFDGVIAGIRDYGNRVGVPTVAGLIGFAPEYLVNPLVNVGCVGLLPARRLLPNRAHAVGDQLVLVGGDTARDGIGGVAFASQELREVSEEESRGAVQLGNPILKEPLIRACLQAYDRGLVQGVKDLGGGGLASASGELVHAGGFGSLIDLDQVPLREAGLRPWEIWISESQERMLLDVAPKDVDELRAIFRQLDVPATVVGSVTTGEFERLRYHGELVANLRLSFRVDPPPAPRTLRRPTRSHPEPGLAEESDLGSLATELLLSPESVSRESIIRQYDHEVRGRTVLKPLHGRADSPSHGDAAVIAAEPDGPMGLAIAVAAQPAACAASPRAGGSWTVEELARNLYAVGGKPDALTNCLNFGNPEDPIVLGSFADCVAGLAAAAKALGFAVPSGNVSFYNGGLGHAIPPTPVVMGVGILPDIARAVTSDLKRPGDSLYLLGPNGPELGGSLYARLRGHTDWAVPPPDPAGLRRRGEKLIALGSRGQLRAVHDVSDGGLAVTLAEMAFGGQLGFEVDLSRIDGGSPAERLVAEGGSRWVVEVAEQDRPEFERAMRAEPCVRMGAVREGRGLLRNGGESVAALDLQALYRRWRAGPSATAPMSA